MPNPRFYFAIFPDFIVDDANISGASRDVDANPFHPATVDNPIVFHKVSIRPEVLAACIVPKQNADLSTITDFIIPHDIVSVTVADRNAVAVITCYLVVDSQSVLHTPTPEQAQIIAFQPVVADQRTL